MTHERAAHWIALAKRYAEACRNFDRVNSTDDDAEEFRKAEQALWQEYRTSEDEQPPFLAGLAIRLCMRMRSYYCGEHSQDHMREKCTRERFIEAHDNLMTALDPHNIYAVQPAGV